MTSNSKYRTSEIPDIGQIPDVKTTAPSDVKFSYVWQSCRVCFCFVFKKFLSLLIYCFLFNDTKLCVNYSVMFIVIICYVSINVLYSFSYSEAMSFATDTKISVIFYSCRLIFHLSCNKCRLGASFVFMFACVYKDRKRK